MTQREEDILLQEFDRRIAYCKFQVQYFYDINMYFQYSLYYVTMSLLVISKCKLQVWQFGTRFATFRYIFCSSRNLADTMFPTYKYVTMCNFFYCWGLNTRGLVVLYLKLEGYASISKLLSYQVNFVFLSFSFFSEGGTII